MKPAITSIIFFFTLLLLKTDSFAQGFYHLTVTRENVSARLQWSTASGEGIAYFDVQRSRDGRTFNSIEVLKASGGSLSTSRYVSTDTNIPAGVIYYRLHIIHTDGSVDYSNTVSMKNTGIGLSVQVYPNPVRDRAMVRGLPGSIVYLELFDRNGHLLEKHVTSHVQFELDLTRKTSGSYFLRIRTANGMQTECVIKN